MFNGLKVLLFLGGGHSQNAILESFSPWGLPYLARVISSQTASYIVSFNFICSRFKVSYWELSYPGRLPNLIRTIISQTSSYIVSFNYLCTAVQSIIMGGSPQRTLKFDPNIYLTNIFLRRKFQLYIFRVQGFILGDYLPPGRPPNLVRTIVSQTSSYIVRFTFLCSPVPKFYFEGFTPHPREPLNLVQTIVSQTCS